MHRYLLFDLDGTLTDPAEGITKCVQYALSYFGQAERRPEELYCYIGPPLPESFETYGGLSREEALLAVEKYRERFREKGMFENKVYPGVEKLLWTLRDAGRVLAVATSKPEVFAKEILGHFGLSEYFQEIVGSELDGTRMDKAEVIREAFARLQTSGIKLILDVFQDGFHLFDVRRVVHGLFFCSTKIAKKPIKPNNSGDFVNAPQIPLRKVPASGKSRKAGYGPHGAPGRILHFSTRNRVETYIFSRFQPNV